MNSASVDLIYADPPFNSNANYAAPIGSKAAGAEFKDTWGLDDVNIAWHGEIKHEHPGLYDLLQTTRAIHGDSMMSYLIYMAVRVIEMQRVLRPTGSLYLHCDPYASHYLKLLLDSLFGKAAFRSEVTWQRTTTHNDSRRAFPNVADILLFYALPSAGFQPVYEPHAADYVAKFYRHDDDDGRGPYQLDTMASPNPRPRMTYEWKGYQPPLKGWRYQRSRMRELDAEGRIYYPVMDGGEPDYSKRLRLKRYLREQKGNLIGNVWTNIRPIAAHAKERTGYPTQKPLALLRRIIRASSNEDDVVLDPFCGCATACIAAELEGRQWAGIDISERAADLVRDRMKREVGLFYTGAHRTDIPQRTDLGKVIRYNDARNKRYLYGEQGGYCNGCEHHFELRNLAVDHIIAKAKGGTDHISNLQLLCTACNSTKGTKSQEYLLSCLTDKGWIKRKKAA